jgi:hypothetical protein
MRQERRLGLTGLVLINLVCIGLAGFVGARFLEWPFSFGLPLFGQLFFFMAFCFLLARRTAIYPDHPSLANATPSAAIEQMGQVGRRLLRVDLVGGGLSIVLGLTLLVAALSLPGIPFLLAGANTTLALGCALLAHSATVIARQPAQEYVRQKGVRATARILKVTNLHYSQRASTYDRARQYLLELEVMPANGNPYKVTVQQLLLKHPSLMPAAGASIPVRYLPEQPQLVVALLEPEVQPASETSA